MGDKKDHITQKPQLAGGCMQTMETWREEYHHNLAQNRTCGSESLKARNIIRKEENKACEQTSTNKKTQKRAKDNCRDLRLLCSKRTFKRTPF